MSYMVIIRIYVLFSTRLANCLCSGFNIHGPLLWASIYILSPHYIYLFIAYPIIMFKGRPCRLRFHQWWSTHVGSAVVVFLFLAGLKFTGAIINGPNFYPKLPLAAPTIGYSVSCCVSCWQAQQDSVDGLTGPARRRLPASHDNYSTACRPYISYRLSFKE